MGWVRDRFLAFNDGVGPKRFTIGAIFSAAVGVAAYIQAALPGSGISPGFPFSLIFGLLVLAGCIAWWLLDYAVKLRRQLKGAVDLEQALDLLSQYFDEGNNKIFNKRVASEADYGAWKVDWKQWYEKIEEHLQKTLGLRERNLFSNIVLFQALLIPQKFNEQHNFELNILYRQLETVRDIIIRHSERADQWRIRGLELGSR